MTKQIPPNSIIFSLLNDFFQLFARFFQLSLIIQFFDISLHPKLVAFVQYPSRLNVPNPSLFFMFRRLEPFSARHQRWSFLLLAINMLKKILVDTFRQLFEAPRKVANAMLMPTMC